MSDFYDTEKTSENELADTSWFTSPCEIADSLESDEWYTPKKYIDLVKEVFGGEIDLDPFSCKLANKLVRARHYYSKEENSLSLPWDYHKVENGQTVKYPAKVFSNPPYSITGTCANKLFNEFDLGNISSAIQLTNTTITDRKWFHKLRKYRNNFALCFIEGRIKFYSSRGSSSNPRDASVFLYLGDSQNNYREFEKFNKVFRNHGLIVT